MSLQIIPVEPSRLSTSQTVIETGTPDASFIQYECPIPEPLAEHRFDSLPLERRGLTSHLRQGNLWQKETLWRDSICAKLHLVNRPDLVEPLAKCHTERSFRVCTGCSRQRVFWNRCELKHCPICAERLARERRESVEWWTKEIRQPKHLVLTALNTHKLSKDYLRWFKDQFAKLRNRKCWRNVRGGFYSIETTWKEEGAHVHLHCLLDCDWLNISAVAIAWGQLLGQDFAICKVKDARDSSYLAEVAKYVVKGSELAAWSGEKLATFLDAIDGVRMFGVFGNLYKLRAEVRDWIDELRSMRNVCECGCKTWEVHDAHLWEVVHGTEPPFIAHSLPPPVNFDPNQTLLTLGEQFLRRT